MAQNHHGFCETHFQNYYVKGIERPHISHGANPNAGKHDKNHDKKEVKEKAADTTKAPSAEEKVA